MKAVSGREFAKLVEAHGWRLMKLAEIDESDL
jgi:hypothetical protein